MMDSWSRVRTSSLAIVVMTAALLVTPGSTLPQILRMIHDIVKHRQWNHVMLLYTEDNGLLTKTEAAQLVAGLMSTISAALLPIAEVKQMYVAYKGTNELLESAAPGSNISLRLQGPNFATQFIVLWDMAGHSADFINKASKLGLFTKQQEWLVLLPQNQTLKDFENSLLYAHIYIDSEVLLSSSNDFELFTLTEVWRVGREQPYLEGLRGLWSPSRGLVVEPSLPDKYERRKDLRGFHLRVATIKTMPYESLIEDRTPENFRKGYVVDVWKILQEQLNFTYTATHTLFGSLQSDGVTWNGMVGMLQTDDADVAVAPLSITKIRSVSIDFTIPIQIVSTRLYIRRPMLESTWTVYGQPFEGYLWICIPFTVFVCAAFLWILNWATLKLGVHHQTISFTDALWSIFSGIVQQSTEVEPQPISGKIVFFSGFWTAMILFVCYSAILVSILTTRQPQLPFKDFDGLLKLEGWNLGVRTNTALADSLALAPPNSPMRLSWETLVGKDPINNLPNNNDDALESVLKGKYAFFANKEYIIYRLQRVLPLKQAMDIVDTKTDFLKRGIGFGLQKGSPYRNLMNHVLVKMTQKGHLDRLKRKWWPSINRNPDASYPTPGFNEVFTVFIILGSGIFLSVIIIIAETYLFTCKRKDDLIHDEWFNHNSNNKNITFSSPTG